MGGGEGVTIPSPLNESFTRQTALSLSNVDQLILKLWSIIMLTEP